MFLDGDKTAEKSITITNTGDSADFVLTLTGELASERNVSLSDTSFHLSPGESRIIIISTNLTSEPENNELVLNVYANAFLTFSKTFKVFLYGSPEIIASVSDSYTVRRGRLETITLLLKNLGGNTDYAFELSDVEGSLAVFDHAILPVSQKLFKEDERAYFNISITIPDDYADNEAELLLSVLYSDEIIYEILVKLEITERGEIHWLMIEDYWFDKEYYLAGDVGMASFKVVNHGDFSESVHSSISFSGKTVKTSSYAFLTEGRSFTVTLPFKIPNYYTSDEMMLSVYSSDVTETEEIKVPIIVPNYDFAIGGYNSTILVDDGEKIRMNVILSNLGNVPNTYEIIRSGYPSTVDSSFVTLNPSSATVLFVRAVAEHAKIQFEDTITVKVCMIDSKDCREATSKLVPKKVKEDEKGFLDFTTGAASKKVKKLGSEVYSITLTNGFSSPKEVDFQIIDDGSVNATLYPSDKLLIPPGSSEHAYLYVIALQDTSPGAHEVTVKAFESGKQLFEQAFVFEVEKESILATAFTFVVSRPLLYLIPLIFVVGVLLFLYLRYRFGGEGAYYEYENYY
jgi:hypothetical protein